jgi:hypothetical protein
VKSGAMDSDKRWGMGIFDHLPTRLASIIVRFFTFVYVFSLYTHICPYKMDKIIGEKSFYRASQRTPDTALTCGIIGTAIDTPIHQTKGFR